MNYAFTLTGLTPMLMHADDIVLSDELSLWRKAPKNKSVSKKGDDRSPPWTWQTYLYSDGSHIVIPQENIMACLRQAGVRMNHPTQRGSLKEATQTGLLINSESCEFRTCGRLITVASIVALHDKTFAEQFAAVKDLGFELKVKRAALSGSKNIRVRAMFRSWEVQGVIIATDPLFAEGLLADVFHLAGHSIGLGDWRPNSKKSPGPYGRFKVELKAVADADSA